MRTAQISQSLPTPDHVVRVSGTQGIISLVGVLIKNFMSLTLEDNRLIIADLDGARFSSATKEDLLSIYEDYFKSKIAPNWPDKDVIDSLTMSDYDNITETSSLLVVKSKSDLRVCVYRRADCLAPSKLDDILRLLPLRKQILVARGLLSDPNENTIQIVRTSAGLTDLIGVDKACIPPNVDDENVFKEIYVTDKNVTYLFRSMADHVTPQ